MPVNDIKEPEYTQITIRLNKRIVEYFKAMSKKNRIPYQILINLYLLECVDKNKEIRCSFNESKKNT